MRGYVVKAGDTLSNIAQALLGSSARWRELQTLNALPSDVIRVGQTLLVPDAPSSANVLAPITASVSRLPTTATDELAPVKPSVAPILAPVTPSVAPILAPVTPSVARLPVAAAYAGTDPDAGDALTQEITVTGKRIDYTVLALIVAGVLAAVAAANG